MRSLVISVLGVLLFGACSLDSSYTLGGMENLPRSGGQSKMEQCLDESSGSDGDQACLELVENGKADDLQKWATASNSTAGGWNITRTRILTIRRRALAAAGSRTLACVPQSNESCPPHQPQDQVITWPKTGAPYYVYSSKGEGVYERCFQKNCLKCGSTISVDCAAISESDLPANIREMLVEWGWPNAY